MFVKHVCLSPLETSAKKMNVKCQKVFDCTQNLAWPRYYYDNPVYQISYQYEHPLQRK